MKNCLIISLLLCSLWISQAQVQVQAQAQDAAVSSPDGKLAASILFKNGLPLYEVKYNGKTILEESPLGFISNVGDFSQNMTFAGKNEGKIDKSYVQDKIKTKNVHYIANELTVRLKNADNKEVEVVFRVSDNDIAFRYQIPRLGGTMSCVIEKETTGFRFPSFTTTFLSTMMAPMGGWGRSTPSYENGYEADGALCKPTRNNEGYVFPGLFHVGDNGWALVSETGVTSLYCASHLKESKDGLYTVGFPNMLQNNGFGSSGAAFGLPGTSPWRTITVGDNLKPIVETTIAYDLVEPLYEPSQTYRYGRSTWSWIVWQDASMNYGDQVKYIDLANAMGYEYILIDALWDVNLGKAKLEELVNYARSKNVDV